MLSLRVEAVTGHYTQPGIVANLSVARTYPIAPPSTVAGFIESLCGKQVGAFAASGSKLAYGWVEGGRPNGRATLLRRNHVTTNPTDEFSKAIKTAEGVRPVLRECLFDMKLRVCVQGPFESLIRQALSGNVERTGVLSLGDSDDMVNWICESDQPTEWLVPGQEVSLPIRVPRKYSSIQAVRGMFGFTPLQTEVPDNAWMSPGGSL